MFCGNCGSKTSEGDLFCTKCGETRPPASASPPVAFSALPDPITGTTMLTVTKAVESGQKEDRSGDTRVWPAEVEAAAAQTPVLAPTRLAQPTWLRRNKVAVAAGTAMFAVLVVVLAMTSSSSAGMPPADPAQALHRLKEVANIDLPINDLAVDHSQASTPSGMPARPSAAGEYLGSVSMTSGSSVELRVSAYVLAADAAAYTLWWNTSGAKELIHGSRAAQCGRIVVEGAWLERHTQEQTIKTLREAYPDCTPYIPGKAATASPPSPAASAPDVAANPLDVVTVGGTATAPTLIFSPKPLVVETTTTKVLTAGNGVTLTKATAFMCNYVMVNGKDGRQVDASFATKLVGMDMSSTSLLPGLSKGLIGQRIGSRLLVAIPPADAFGAQGNAQAGVGPTDTVLFLIDLVSAGAPLTTATGVAVAPIAGLPTAQVDGAKVAQITVPKIAPPSKLVVQPLIKGAGPVVKSGQNIKVNYTGVLWKDGKKFDASADHGSSFITQIGAGQVIAAWDKGLVGQNVGSRVMLVVPPADGYGSKGSTGIGPTDTLVFVIDILAIL